MRFPLLCTLCWSRCGAESKLLMALWAVGEEGRGGNATKGSLGDSFCYQTAATAELEWMAFAPQGKSRLKVSLSRTQISVSGGRYFRSTPLVRFWGWAGVFLNGGGEVRAPASCRAGTGLHRCWCAALNVPGSMPPFSPGFGQGSSPSLGRKLLLKQGDAWRQLGARCAPSAASPRAALYVVKAKKS